MFVNVYLLCVGTTDRAVISDDIRTDIWAWRELYSNCQLFIAGDFNVCLDNNNNVYSSNINDFLLRHSLSRCDNLFPLQAKVATYVNAALSHQSQIDYAVISSSKDVVNFEVLDPDLNFSDHLPLLTTVAINYLLDDNRHLLPDTGSKRLTQRLRWDYIDRTSYYNYTGVHLSPILTKLNDLTSSDDVCSKDYIYRVKLWTRRMMRLFLYCSRLPHFVFHFLYKFS